MRAPLKPRRARRASVYWFSIEACGRAGRVGRRAATWFIARAPNAEIETIMPLGKIPLKGEHNVENVLAAVCAARLAGCPARQFAGADREVSGRGASAGICGHGQRRGVLQRLEGHQRGRDREGRGCVSRRHSSDSGRQRQGLGLYAAGAAAARAGARGVHHRRGGGQNRIATARGGLHPLLRNAGQCGERGGRGGAPGEVVLLAPACSSFDQFENYEQRGRVFKQLVGERRSWKVGQSA